MNKRTLCSLGLLLAGMALASAAAADGDSDSDSDSDRHHQGPIFGAYIAQLDLSPIDPSGRIEALGIVLHADGTVSYISEHEPMDLESAGIGLWERLRGRRIGMGVLGFHVGDSSGCFFIFGILPPDNCVLKIGATFDREKSGRLVGKAILTFETLDGVPFELPPLDITMERLSLKDFPGALPSH